MPQKGQITKHEWRNSGYKSLYSKCPHCKVVRFAYGAGMRSQYTFPDGSVTFDKPKCITRKIQADGDSTAT
jgi:phage FluMu protein Com